MASGCRRTRSSSQQEGATPRLLGISGEELLLHADGFMDLEELPLRIVFMGGGYISFEFAALARRRPAGRASHPSRGRLPPLGCRPAVLRTRTDQASRAP